MNAYHNLIGMEVGATRWPYSSAHPGCWGRPWKGAVLAVNDPRAWRGTIAFGDAEPTQDQVDAHIARVRRNYFEHPRLRGAEPFADTVPVAWEFGAVHWERVTSIRPYAEDLEAWTAARSAALARAAA